MKLILLKVLTDYAEQSRAEPIRAEPSRTDPSRGGERRERFKEEGKTKDESDLLTLYTLTPDQPPLMAAEYV